MNEDWRAEAACRGTDTADFFDPERLLAPEVCLTCPVRRACLDFAVETRQDDGWWGGLSEDERRKLSSGPRRTPADVGLGSIACGDERGTPAGYQRHRRSHELACERCRMAHTDQTRLYKDAKRRTA